MRRSGSRRRRPVHCSGVRSSSAIGGAPVPALLNSRSRRPNDSSVRANNARTDCGSLTSVGTTSVLDPLASPSRAVASRRSCAVPRARRHILRAATPARRAARFPSPRRSRWPPSGAHLNSPRSSPAVQRGTPGLVSQSRWRLRANPGAQAFLGTAISQSF